MKKNKEGEYLTITNDFMFNRVMRNSEICSEFLEDILPEIKIRKLEYVETQKTIESNIDAKGVRLDVYAEDSDKVYNIELQRVNNYDLPHRTRYYQGHIDMDLLLKGGAYGQLKDSYIIFICTFDPFGYKEYIYQFENKCKEIKDLSLNDGTFKIFLNTKGNNGKIKPELEALLAYFENRQTENKTSLVQKIEKAVEEANKDKEWRREVMTLEMKIQDERKAALREGIKQGMQQGMRKGMQQGMQQGREQGIEEVAVRLLRQNHPIPFIVELTDLPEEKVFELKKNMK